MQITEDTEKQAIEEDLFRRYHIPWYIHTHEHISRECKVTIKPKKKKRGKREKEGEKEKKKEKESDHFASELVSEHAAKKISEF